RFAAPDQVERTLHCHADTFEGMISLPVRFEFQQRRPEWIETLARRHAENQPVQILQRQRANQQGINGTKDGVFRAVAYSKGSYVDVGLIWCLNQLRSAE